MFFNWFKTRDPKYYTIEATWHETTEIPGPTGPAGVQGPPGVPGLTEEQIVELMEKYLKPESFK